MVEVESAYVNYSRDEQVMDSHSSVNLTQEGYNSGDEEAYNSFYSTWEKQTRMNNDDGSFEIPKGADKVELSPDALEQTFEAIIAAHSEILESNKPTAGLSQLREVQELAWYDQRRFASYVIGRRCSQMKEKGKE